jgi:hypothetical protein
MEGSLKLKNAGSMGYDGTQIAPLWAYSELGVQGDSVIFFIGEMKVPRDSLIDIEDFRSQKVDYPISSEKAIHFIIEHFDSPSLRLAYHRQRIIVNIAKERIINASGIHVKRTGSDLYVNEKKLSVSVATASASSSKIHLGINVTSRGVPKGVKAIGLEELKIKDVTGLAKAIANGYAGEIKGIEKDISKSRVF